MLKRNLYEKDPLNFKAIQEFQETSKYEKLEWSEGKGINLMMKNNREKKK